MTHSPPLCTLTVSPAQMWHLPPGVLAASSQGHSSLKGGITFVTLSQITLEKGSYVQNCEVSSNSLILRGLFKSRSLKVLVSFLVWVLLLPSHWFFSPEHKGRVSVRYFVVPFSFQCLSNLCHFINSAVREQKREKWRWENLKQTQNLFKIKEKNNLYFYCLLSAESCLLFLLYLWSNQISPQIKSSTLQSDTS